MSNESLKSAVPLGGQQFATTHWSMVLAAGHRSSPDSNEALESLCQRYWYPLYAFVRRRGHSPEDAQDLTQEFFARLLQKEYLKTADRNRGRFRTFLLTVFKRFLSKERERAAAQKRGGGLKQLSIDFASGEDRYRFEPADDWTAEKIYQRRWALTLLDCVLAGLEHEYHEKGKGQLFIHCKAYLGGPAPSYAETADALKMSAGAVRVAVHRLKQRYRELLTIQVAQTLDDSTAVNDELNELRAAIRGKKM